jgi:RimJ/RimL family protein N-acetyltransferase
MTVALRPLQQDDLKRIYDWQCDPALYDHLVGSRRAVSWDEARAWMTRHWLPQGSDHRFALTVDGELVGCVYLLAVEGETDALAFHIFIGDPRARGKGTGRAALGAALRMAFDTLGAERVRLEVLETNAAARHLYESAGFVPDGPARVVDKPAGPVRAIALVLKARAYRAR